MSYETAVAQMYALGHELAQTPSHKFDLAHMRVLLAALGHPESRFPTVLVAGTNGKGSTAATLTSILQASGLKTGLYTSPHLVRINERIRLDGAPIGDDDFALLHDVVYRTAERLVGEDDLPWHPSFFEMLTALETADDHTAFCIRAHIGNHSLFLSGVFPEHILHRVERRGAPGLRYYQDLGRANYRAASNHRLAARYDLAAVFDTLSEKFEPARRALNDLSERLFSLGDPEAPGHLLNPAD